MQLGKLDVSEALQGDIDKTGQFSAQSRQWVTSQKQNPRAKAYRTDLTAARLRELLSYDPLTGEFRWLVALNNHSYVGKTYVGKIAGCINSRGYIVIGVDGERYVAHRLAFLYMTGKFPDLDVDHADGNPLTNRWSNLREATQSLNNANMRRSRHNTSGFKGTSWVARSRKWRADIGVSGRQIYLGCFETSEDAHAAYMVAAAKHFGEFASCGTEASRAPTP